MVERIDSFKGEYRFLSNFWMAEIIHDCQKWLSAEHAYQAAKTLDEDEKAYVRSQPTPGKAKRAGSKVTLREDWDEVKIGIMEEIVRAKFFSHRELGNRLLETKDAELIEGNHWGDTFWGVCKGEGGNHLGKVLMKIREELVNVYKARNEFFHHF